MFDRLQDPEAGLALVVGDYGSGKTHFLEYVMQRALNEQWVVSRLTLDARNGVRMNRMDQFVGALNRGIRVPGYDEGGIADLLDAACSGDRQPPEQGFEQLACRPMRSALANWQTGLSERQELVRDWLENPTSYTNSRNYLRSALAAVPPGYSYLDWSEWSYGSARGWASKPSDFSFKAARAVYRYGGFTEEVEPFHSSWTWVTELPVLARMAGFRGLLVLIDEFEDVTSNLRRSDYVSQALENVSGLDTVRVDCLWVLAVTPSYVAEASVLGQCRLDSDAVSIPDEAILVLDQLTAGDLQELARRVIAVHETAYGWRTRADKHRVVADVLRETSGHPLDGRPRMLAKRMVEVLDQELENREGH